MEKNTIWISNIMFAVAGFALGALLVLGLFHYYGDMYNIVKPAETVETEKN